MLKSIEDIKDEIKSMFFSFDEVVKIINTLVDDLEYSSDSPDVKRCAKWFRGRVDGLVLREAAAIAYKDPIYYWRLTAIKLARGFQEEVNDPEKRQLKEKEYQEFIKIIKDLSAEDIVFRILNHGRSGFGAGS